MNCCRPSRPSTTGSADFRSLRRRPRCSGEIEFRHLNFSYGETPVLRDMSLQIPAGSSLAIVGPTGSRKIDAGQPAFAALRSAGGLAADRWPAGARSIRWPCCARNIGMVPQETFLFSETIRENLAFGAPNAERRRDAGSGRGGAHPCWSSKSFRRDLKPWWANAA